MISFVIFLYDFISLNGSSNLCLCFNRGFMLYIFFILYFLLYHMALHATYVPLNNLSIFFKN